MHMLLIYLQHNFWAYIQIESVLLKRVQQLRLGALTVNIAIYNVFMFMAINDSVKS